MDQHFGKYQFLLGLWNVNLHGGTRVSLSDVFTLTWRNTASMSPTKAILCFWNRRSALTRLSKSGPVNNSLFKLLPLYFVTASDTTYTFPGFCGWKTGWCGKYHVLFYFFCCHLSCITFLNICINCFLVFFKEIRISKKLFMKVS